MPPQRWIADRPIAMRFRGTAVWRAWVAWDRFQFVIRLNWRYAKKTWSWLIHSREHSNYTYALTDRNMTHMAWWVANLVDKPVEEIQAYLREISDDVVLEQHISAAVTSARGSVAADRVAAYGRRSAWYAIVRALKPEHVVETGTDRGLGSCVLASAVLRNGHGKVTTIDTEARSGFMISAPYNAVIDRRIGDSHHILPTLEPADIFLHDSLHTYAHEAGEYSLARLSARALVLSDNADLEDALLDWAVKQGRTFSYFQEVPRDHWFPGNAIGAARV